MKWMARDTVVATQTRLLKLLGGSQEGRSTLVAGMLRRDANEGTGYWLQLVVSVGIGTLGLVGSAAVIIGAMLVAPLMMPIVGLAMGLATGSPFLVLRSAGRIGLSVSVAIGGAAVITSLLPFHELNAEITARTSPTVLDLVTASFCAIVGVYAVLRSGSDMATTAAGTSISISLVPPLCASGFCAGTAAWSAAGGAALLFLTNMVAIVAVGTVSFVALGFDRVDVAMLERAELQREVSGARIAGLLARKLASVFESSWGPGLRFAMPFALLASVYVPLRRGLDEVAWQVRVRAAVRDSLSRGAERIVQSRVRVERHEVDLVMVILGTTADAEQAQARVSTELARAAGVAPHLEVLAVPDATAFAGLESTLVKPHAVKTVPVPAPTPAETIEAGHAQVRAAVNAVWPLHAVGEPLVIEADTAAVDELRIRVVHLGAPLDQQASEIVQRGLATAFKRPAPLLDVAVPLAELTREDGDLSFLSRLSAGIRATAAITTVYVCVGRPAPPSKRRIPASELEFAQAVDDVLQGHPHVITYVAPTWSARFAMHGCTSFENDGGANIVEGVEADAGTPRRGARATP